MLMMKILVYFLFYIGGVGLKDGKLMRKGGESYEKVLCSRVVGNGVCWL